MQEHNFHLTFAVGGSKGFVPGRSYGATVRDINNECGSSRRAFA